MISPQVPLTPIDGGTPGNPAESRAWSVGVRAAGSDQVVVHIAVESRLLGWGLLLHLSKTQSICIKTVHFNTDTIFTKSTIL